MSMDIDPPTLVASEPPPSGDSVGRGCLYGCLCQIGFIGFGSLAAVGLKGGNLQSALFVSWGVTQWIALVPLIWQQKGKEHPRTVQGIIVTGSIGLMLSSACAAMIFGH
jgi:hypothetical protein